jgi:hypothetical protein
MNKELIKKYREEFEYWLNGGDLEIKFLNDTKARWKVVEKTANALWDFEPNEVQYVIKDSYVEFRKALAEGKTIEWNRKWEFTVPEEWVEITEDITRYVIDVLRIKPEEPHFKVGDWVNEKGSETPRCLDKEYIEIINKTNTWEDFTKWQPKQGEWCWFYDDKKDNPFTSPLEEIFSIGDTIYQSKYTNKGKYMWNYCEPFIGQLPTILQEK